MTNLIHLESRTLGAAVSCHGASLTQLISKKRHVELLLDSSLLAATLIDEFCIGGTVGPYAGRLRQTNSSTGESTVLLHGGESALHRLDWRLEHTDHATTVRYVTSLSHGEGGLPGVRNFGVSYTLVDDCLIIELAASTSHDTPISLTNHAYFTLGARSVSELMLQLTLSRCGHRRPACATGESLAVAGTQLDSRKRGRFQVPMDMAAGISTTAMCWSPRCLAGLRPNLWRYCRTLVTASACMLLLRNLACRFIRHRN